MTTMERIGFMQGRLSAMVDGKIQAFPWNEWREEFPRASALGLTRIEWTIDQDRLRENPLNTAAGQQEIIELSRRNGLEAGEPDRRLLHAGAVLEGGRRDAEIAGRRSRSGARLLQHPRHRIRRHSAGRQRQDRERRADARPCCAFCSIAPPRYRSRASRSSSNPICRPHRWRSSSTNSRARCSASITTAATAPRSAMIPPRRFRPTRRAFSMCM